MFKTLTLAKAILLADQIFVTVWVEDGQGIDVKISKKAARRVMKDFLKVQCEDEEMIWENKVGSIVAAYYPERNFLSLGR